MKVNQLLVLAALFGIALFLTGYNLKEKDDDKVLNSVEEALYNEHGCSYIFNKLNKV